MCVLASFYFDVAECCVWRVAAVVANATDFLGELSANADCRGANLRAQALVYVIISFAWHDSC